MFGGVTVRVVMRKNIFLIVLVVFLFGACVTANTQQSNSMPTPSGVILSPTPQNIFLPTAQQVDEILQEAADKYDISNLQTMSLAKQPKEFAISLAPIEGEKYDPNNLKWAENIQIVTGERDLNHDGTAERVIVQFSDKNGSTQKPNAYFFRLIKEKWQCLTCPILIYLSDNTEFVPTGRAGEFDILRFKSEVSDVAFLEDLLSESELKKWKDYISDARVVNGKYVFYECRVVNKKTKKIVPCPK